MYRFDIYPIPHEEIPAYFFDEHGNMIYPSTTVEEFEEHMAQTDVHFNWITTLKGNLQSMFRHRTDVYVTADIYWYVDEKQPTLRVAPDLMVVFGRPNEDRDSYQQWKEENIIPQVIFEVISKSNTYDELHEKFLFYEKYGVEEYYAYHPTKNKFYAWLREGDRLNVQLTMPDIISPRLGIRMEIQSDTLRVFKPDGSRFVTFLQNAEALEDAEKAKLKAQEAASKARAEEQQAQVEEEKAQAEAEAERQAKEKALEEIEALKALIKKSGLDTSS